MRASAAPSAATLVLAALIWAPSVSAAVMPVAEQNVLIQQRCAVCHSDTARNGGLSLERFDAGQASPSLVAMLLSKITNGVALETVRAMAEDAAAAKVVNQRIMGGALFAAGLPIPPVPAMRALTEALGARTLGAEKWSVTTTRNATGEAAVTVASVMRQLPPERKDAVAPVYRLSLTCDRTTRVGEIRLSWAPAPTAGTLLVVSDGAAPATHVVEGKEPNGNGSPGTSDPSSVVIFETQPSSNKQIPLPTRSLRFSGLYPGEAPEFSFVDLDSTAKRSLAACFSGVAAGRGRPRI